MTARTRPTVLISGGGPIGLTVAALLLSGPCAGRLELRVLESRAVPPWDPECMDLRVYALSRASQQILERLDLWHDVVDARAGPYRRMRVWEGADPTGLGSLEFDSADIGEPDLGHIVEDRLLRTLLTGLVGASPEAQIDVAAELKSVAIARHGVEVELADGRSVHGTLLIAADGSDSTIRSLLDFPVVTRGYAQQAVVTHVGSERFHEQTAWQRFLPGGPLALLPLADGRSSVVWSVPEQQAEALLRASDAEFLAALREASGNVLGELGPCAERASFRLQLVHALRYTQPRAVLIGDAAHTVHPLAGQGMNLGLLDAACLAAVVERAVLRGEDAGDLRVLRRYERQRKGHNLKMLVTLDALHHLFRLPAWAVPGRALGLGAVSSSRVAKRVLMHRALGLDQVPWRAGEATHRGSEKRLRWSHELEQS